MCPDAQIFDLSLVAKRPPTRPQMPAGRRAVLASSQISANLFETRKPGTSASSRQPLGEERSESARHPGEGEEAPTDFLPGICRRT